MNTQNRFISLMSIWIFTLMIISSTSCGKKADNMAVVAAVIGKVELIKSGEKPKQLRVKDILEKNDIVKTGAGSFVSIQIGNSSMVNILEKSSLKISSLDSGKEFFLEQGKVFSKILKLEKGASHTMYTKTTTAAVRGTVYSVYATDKQTVVAVNDGKILVKKSSDSGKDEEKIIDKGSAAVVAEKIKTRPISKEEKKEFQKVEEMSPRIIDKETGKKETQNISTGASALVLKTTKIAFRSSEPVNVDYINMPDNRNAWVSIATLAAPGGSHIAFDWTYGNKNGRVTFKGLNLQPGIYEIRAHFGRSNNIDKKTTFTVVR